MSTIETVITVLGFAVFLLVVVRFRFWIVNGIFAVIAYRLFHNGGNVVSYVGLFTAWLFVVSLVWRIFDGGVQNEAGDESTGSILFRFDREQAAANERNYHRREFNKRF